MIKKRSWMCCVLDNVSVVIPCAAGENAVENLLQDLGGVGCEVLVCSDGTRAKSLNAGAAKATGEFLWFLHADSRVSHCNLEALLRSLKSTPDALHYFDLKYDGGGLVALNAWAANVRSKVFGLPYGDQGFCVSRVVFDRLGGYREDVEFGEDLLFVRRAKREGVAVKCVGSALMSSARAYGAYGWLKLTLARHRQFWALMGMDL